MTKKRYLSPAANVMSYGVEDMLAVSVPDNYGGALDSWGWNQDDV